MDNDTKDLTRRIENQRQQLAVLNALVKRLQKEVGRPVKTVAWAFKNSSDLEKSIALKMLNVIENTNDQQEIAMAIHTMEDALNHRRRKHALS